LSLIINNAMLIRLSTIVSLIFLITVPIFIFAQTPVYRQFTVSNGLPSATVYCILQDFDGYTWFGTENGACRFDGKTFKAFTMKDGLSDNVVLKLYQDKQGRIWFFTLNGKLCYYQNERIYNAYNSPFLAKLPSFGLIFSCIEDDENNFYLATVHDIIKISQNEKYTIIHDLPAEEISILPGRIQRLSNSISVSYFGKILFNPKLSFYFYTFDGLFRYSRNTKMVISAKKIPVILKTSFQKRIKNDFWITSGYDGIIQIRNFLTDKFQIKKHLAGIEVSQVFEDKEENLWFCTSGQGVFLIAKHVRDAWYFSKDDGLPEENIRVLYKDKQNKIWAGSVKNNLYSIESPEVKKYSMPTSKPNLFSPVYDICESPSGNLYVATSNELICYNNKLHYNKASILKTAFKDKFHWDGNYKSLSVGKNGVLLATNPYVLSFFNETDQLGKKSMMSYIIPSKGKRMYTSTIVSGGTIWVANEDGLNKLEGDSLLPFYSLDTVLKEPISRIIETGDSNLLLATRSKGIILFSGTKVLQNFTEDDGLSSNICNKIFLDKNEVWVATAKGLSKLIYEEGKLKLKRKYLIDDGLISDEINDVVVLNDTIYVATANGLSVLLQRKHETSSPPPLFFSSIMYGDEKITNLKDTFFEFNHNNISFSYNAIAYQHPSKVQYKYHLKGANEPWKTSDFGMVNYSALLPGDYIFEVKAKNIDSDWSPVIRFKFGINTPFWMRNWFWVMVYSCSFTSIALIIYYLIRRKRNLLIKKKEVQNRIIQLEYRSLSALMNPHFIFNALNSIQQYLNQNDNFSANKFLSMFARMTRKNMDAVMKNYVSLEDEIERLNLYLKFEKMRFGDKLNYIINVPDELKTDELFLPPMILQPFVENAIWHGLMPLPKGGEINIDLKLLDDQSYQICISDNGIGIDASMELKKNQKMKHKSRGMNLTIERLELWTRNKDKKFDIKIEHGSNSSNKNVGTNIILTLPINN